jgi:hypothetical protein
MWTDWQGYLLVILLVLQLMIEAPRQNTRISAALALAAFLSGIAFLVQIRIAMPGAWQELFDAFRQRSGHGDLSGGAFTTAQWIRTEFDYLTTLFHPVAWLLAAAGALVAFLERRRLSKSETAPFHIGAALFVIDAFYICALRNQSYIHDFASFYFLVPIAIFSGLLIERAIRLVEARWPGYRTLAAALACCVLPAALIWSGIRRLDGIDTQFCILDDDNTEPDTLMPDVGRLIDRTFPPDAVVICNFDRYYSPLPYYARRVMVNDVHTYPDWRHAVSDAAPQNAGGIIWAAAPDAPALVSHLPAAETRRVTVDGIPFVLWLPHAG